MIKAVVVGINAYPQSPLQGCLNDATDVITYLTGKLGYDPDDILPLYDSRATKAAIVAALTDMIASASPGDHLLFHYSGHGAQVASRSASEPDGLDECLCPVDFDWGDPDTAFLDDELAAILATVPDGAALTAVLDSCHSGDMSRDQIANRRPRFLAPPPDVAFRLARRTHVVRRRSLASSNSVVVSACRSDQTAADTSFNNRANGAFTYNWLTELGGHANSPLLALVADTVGLLASFNMTPQLDGLLSLQQATFLLTPPPLGRSFGSSRQLTRTPAQVVFDEAWTTNVLGTAVGVELAIAIVAGGFEFQLSSTAGIPLRWTFDINGNTTQRVDLGYGFALVLATSGWSASAADVGFDLAIRVAPPFFGQVTITQQHVTIPVSAIPRAIAVPTSAADLLAMIQLSKLGYPTEPTPVPPAVVPRDGENQWTGIAAIENFSGGLFGCSYNKNTNNSYIPPGFVRDHIEVLLNPPGSGNVHFNSWNDSDPHIGGFEYHVGCSSCGGGTATFYLHCVRDPAVIRAFAGPQTITVMVPGTAAPASKPTNGHAGPRELGEGLQQEVPQAGGSIRA